MPGTFEAALVFAYAIVPGYLGLTGYQVGRARKRAAPDRDLHVIAEAFVLSLFWIVLPPVALAAIELAEWISASPIDTSTGKILLSVALVVVVFFLPLVVGYGSGRFVEAARKGAGGKPGQWLRRIPQQQTAWDTIWEPVLEENKGRALVRVEFDDDRDGVTGQFAERSQVDLSPDPPQLFLESTLVAVKDSNNAMQIEEGPGMHVDGTKVRYITVEPLDATL